MCSDITRTSTNSSNAQIHLGTLCQYWNVLHICPARCAVATISLHPQRRQHNKFAACCGVCDASEAQHCVQLRNANLQAISLPVRLSLDLALQQVAGHAVSTAGVRSLSWCAAQAAG